MAFTQTQLDNLETAIATGAMSVEFDGKRTQFRTLDEMMRTRNTIRQALGLAPSKRFSLAAFTKDSSQPTRSTIDPFNTNVTG